MHNDPRPVTCIRVKSGKLYCQEMVERYDYGAPDPVTGKYGKPVYAGLKLIRSWRQIREDGKGGWKWYGPCKNRLAGEEVSLPCHHEDIRG